MRGRAILALLLLLPAPAATADGGLLAPQVQDFSSSAWHRFQDGDGNVEALVVLAPDAPREALEALAAVGLHVGERFAFAHVVHVDGPAAGLVRAEALPFVANVDPVEPVTVFLAGSRELVRADAARQRFGEDGRNVTIAVVDSGVDATHPAFKGRIRAAVKLTGNGDVVPATGDADGHGTHVAGIAVGSGAGSVNNRHRGVAPGAGLVAVDISSSFTTLNALRAFQWIHDHHDEHDIRVVVNSWGREKADARYDPDDAVTRAANALVADGIVLVFSAGNRGEDGEATLTEEAMNPNVLAVGATTRRGDVERYSSRGPALDKSGRELPWVKPDLVAPGTGIVSARTSADAPASTASEEDRYYTVMNGTSMAAPHVAAAAALLVSKDPTLSPAAVAALLTASARDLGTPGPDMDVGYGLLDVEGALKALDATRGEVRTFTVVRERPVNAHGRVTAVAGNVLYSSAGPELPPEREVVIPLDVPDGGARTRFDFTWTGGVGAFSLTLRAPSGKTYGPFLPAGEERVHVDAEITPGRWEVIARPTGLASHAEYKMDGVVDVLETRVLREPPKLPPRFNRPLWADAAAVFTDGPVMLPALGVSWPVVGLGSLALGGGLTAFVLRSRFRGGFF